MTESSKSRNDVHLATASIPEGAVPLDSILCTEELRRRPSRPPDYKKEADALVVLSRTLAGSPGTILQTLAETILEVTQSDSSGVSLLTPDGKRFYWPAIAGRWKPHIGGGTPRDFGPCGDVLDRNTPLLMRHFEWRYTYFLPITPPVEESLLVPFYVGGKAVGTIWVLMHDGRHKFDGEHERLLCALGQFASLVYQTLASIDALKFHIAEREKAESALRELTNTLETRVRVRTEELEQEIAERSRAEYALRQSEARFREILEVMPAAIYVCDMNGIIQQYNPKAVELWGRHPRPDDPDMRYCGSLRAYRPDGTWLPHEENPVAETLRTGIPVRNREIVVERPDGSRVTVVANIAHLSNEKGEQVGVINCLLDITERKRAEDALRQAEEQYRVLIEISPQTVWMGRPDGYNTYCNQWWFNYTGLTMEQTKGDGWLQAVHPDHRERLSTAWLQAIATGGEWNVEIPYRRADGQYRWHLSRGLPIRDGEGRIVKWMGIAIDIHDRREAEEEHQAHLQFLESMDRVNRAIQGTNDLERMMSDVLDAALPIFDCDRAWLAYPCDPEAASWKVPMEHVRPEFPGAFTLGHDVPVDPGVAKVFQALRGSSGPVRFGPGSEHPLPPEAANRFGICSMMAMALYPKGEKPYLFGLQQCSGPRAWTPQEERLFQEIGRRLEDALTSLLLFRNLSESERKLEEAQRLTHVGYWELDPDTDIVTWADETYRIFGLRPQERIITLGQLQELIHLEDRQMRLEAVAEAHRGSRQYDVEYRVVRPNGEVRIVHSQGDVKRDESGRPRRFFGTVQDITERKRAEEALRKAQADLAHAARVMTMGELASSIAHEINQPLTAVVTNGNACNRWLAAVPPNLEEAREAVSRIIREGSRAGDVIRRIRAFLKKAPPQMERVGVNALISEVVTLVHHEILRLDALLRMDLADGLPPVRGDRVQLQQVILNLIMNSLDAMRAVTDGNRELRIATRKDEAGHVLVAVEDTGAGIDPQCPDKLFDAFYTTKPDGLGMGLSISRSIIEAHGGRLWATANGDHGATFQFTLPADEGNQPA